jgi:hypothetical protein
VPARRYLLPEGKENIVSRILVPVLLLLTACAMPMQRDDNDVGAASSSRSTLSKRHVARAFVGGTSQRGGGGFTLGGQYEYRIDQKWGAGAVLDFTFGSDFASVIGGAGYWHPWRSLNVMAAPAVDLNNDDFFVRLGASYDFPLKQYDISLAPALYVDVGAKSTPIMIGILVSKDF